MESTNPTVIAIDDSLSQSMELLNSVVPENVHIEYTLHAPESRVLIDASRFEQIVINLIFNARDAMPKGGAIVVSTEAVRLDEPLNAYVRSLQPGWHLCLQVADSGEGIDADTLPRIFEPFFSTKDRSRESGFGLATVYATTEDAGGAIEIGSTVGQGTTFSVYLPIAEQTPALQVERADHDDPERGTETVLVVQEEDGIRHLVTRILRNHGYLPVVARSVGDALLMMEQNAEIREINTDRSAPYLSVSQIVERYRSIAGNDVAILLTVSGGIEEAGQDGVIQKPFEPATLLHTMRVAIDRRLNSVGSS